MNLSLKQMRVLSCSVAIKYFCSFVRRDFVCTSNIWGSEGGSLPKVHVLLSLFHILNQNLYKTMKYHTLRPFATGRGKIWLHNIILHTHTHPPSLSNDSLSNLHRTQSSIFFLKTWLGVKGGKQFPSYDLF